MEKKKKTIKRKKKVKKEPKLAPVNLYKQSIDFAVEQFRNGTSEKTIVETIHEANKRFTPENLAFIINRASLEIANEYARDRGSIVSVHVRRYNVEAKKLLVKTFENRDDTLEVWEWRKRRLEELQTILDILFAKERVLQIHAKDTQVKIFNRLNAKIKERKIAYDLSPLSIEEKIEFLVLVLKAKRTTTELFSVQLKGKENKVEDIAFEDVTENNNIKQIEKYNERVPEVEPEPIVLLSDVTKKIQAALIKKAEQEFKAKGASIDKGPEIIDLTHLNKRKK